MKLRYQYNAFGPKVQCIDESEYDGSPESLMGQGDTEEEAKRDFWQLWLNREAMRDIKRGAPASQSWDSMMRRLTGMQS